MKKIFLSTVVLMSMNVTTYTYQDLAESLDNIQAGTTISTTPLDLSIGIRNNGVLMLTGDPLYFSIYIGRTYCTFSGFIENSVLETILNLDFSNGATFPIFVDPISMQTM